MQTLGFRGEALASISQVARVKITSRPQEQAYAVRLAAHVFSLVLLIVIYVCCYFWISVGFFHGTVEEKAKRMAGNPGTVVDVKNLFFEQRPRLTELTAHKRAVCQDIVDVVAKYALRFPSVAFFVSNVCTCGVVGWWS